MNGTFSRVACACCLQFIRLAILTYGCSTDTQGCYWEPNAALDNGLGCVPDQDILEGLGEPMVAPVFAFANRTQANVQRHVRWQHQLVHEIDQKGLQKTAVDCHKSGECQHGRLEPVSFAHTTSCRESQSSV